MLTNFEITDYPLERVIKINKLKLSFEQYFDGRLNEVFAEVRILNRAFDNLMRNYIGRNNLELSRVKQQYYEEAKKQLMEGTNEDDIF